MPDPKQRLAQIIKEARLAEEERGKTTATSSVRWKRDIKAATLAFQQTILPVLREVNEWLRTQAIITRLDEADQHPRFRAARLLVFPPRFAAAEPEAPYVGFRFDEATGEVYCFTQFRNGHLNDDLPPTGQRWKPQDLTRDAVRNATYTFLEQLFLAHK